jgi:hypothetical protein
VPIELPAQAIVALATIAAALITAALSFVNLTLTKELKTSEFRQAWIDALREDLALFLSAGRAFARSAEMAQIYAAEYMEKTLLPISKEKISELRHSAAETFYRIKLRLNPDEPEHKELLRLIEAAVSQQNKMLTEHTNNTETLAALDRASDYAQPVLKKEWERVKRGELPFRLVRNWIAPIIVLLCVVFVAFVLTGNFRG